MANAGDSPLMRCPRCKTVVAEAAFHEEDKLTKFIVGEDALSWDQAIQACQEVCPTPGGIVWLTMVDMYAHVTSCSDWICTMPQVGIQQP